MNCIRCVVLSTLYTFLDQNHSHIIHFTKFIRCALLLHFLKLSGCKNLVGWMFDISIKIWLTWTIGKRRPEFDMLKFLLLDPWKSVFSFAQSIDVFFLASRFVFFSIDMFNEYSHAPDFWFLSSCDGICVKKNRLVYAMSSLNFGDTN